MRLSRRSMGVLIGLTIVAATLGALARTAGAQDGGTTARLDGRAVLPATTFAEGPVSGTRLGSAPINGVPAPFPGQPVQGFSAVLDNEDGTYNVMADNGYGAIENSADFHLRVYRIRPNFRTRFGGNGTIDVLSFFQLRDPDRRIPFAITNAFTDERVLTGADFDIEAMQRSEDGSLWFGDEFGPFVLHTDGTGKVLDAPFPLPDVANPSKEIRSPQNPYSEESTALRIMNAVRTHARLNGNTKAPVISPWHVMLDDANAATSVDNRRAPATGIGLAPASSEIFNVASLKAGGYPVVPYTINDKARMTELLRLGVDGIISDRPDLLREAVAEYDADRDGTAGDFLTPAGLIDRTKIDAQGHRGGRDLRPENTLPAMEVALDNLMTTVETDSGVTRDGIAVQDHDPYVEAEKCRRADGATYGPADEVLLRNVTVARLQRTYICDRLFRGPTQRNDRALSPAASAFAASRGLIDPYVMPTLEQLFAFADFYVDYYRKGPGSTNADAERRWRNAESVRFNVETKINPRTDTDDKGAAYASRTVPPNEFVDIVAGTIVFAGLTERADIQSFDFRTLLRTQQLYPAIRTVFLFGDFPKFALTEPLTPGTDDGTNLQPQSGQFNTPWLAGLYWPYRSTALSNPFRAQRSGGFEGMALTRDGESLLPMLELPLTGGDPSVRLVAEFDTASKSYTATRYLYPVEAPGNAIGDFIMFDRRHGLVIERDGSQGNLNGFKRIYEITLPRTAGGRMRKELAVNLLRIDDPFGISGTGLPGDVGLGPVFGFPFTTIEDVVFFDRRHIGVLNDNNFPFSVGRHLGTGQPDDNEFIVLRLDHPLGR